MANTKCGESDARRYGIYDSCNNARHRGDLAPVFRAAGACLAGGGHFCFTVERAEGAGHALGAHARYAHARPYLEDLAGECGFAVRLLEDISTRREAGAPVPGLVCVLAVG